MQVDNIRLKNFKCFEEASVDLSKITLITGENSSGKSSLLYSILGAIQSNEFPFNFSPNGKFINMGDYTDIVHSHDKKKWIEIGFDIKSPKKSKDIIYRFDSKWSINNERNLPKLRDLSFSDDDKTISISKGKGKRKYTFTYTYNPIENEKSALNHDEKIFSSLVNSLSDIFKDEKDNIFSDKDVQKHLNDFSSVKERISFKVDDLGQIDNSLKFNGDFISFQFYNKLLSVFNEFEQDINFISSFRSFPERTYYETSKTNLKVSRSGDNYVDQILLWESNRDHLYEELNDNLQSLKLVHRVNSNSLDGARFELQVINKKDGIQSSINDVGFGVSQFLPILVADLQMKSKGTLFVAQPEIHLHPSIQANFGDYLAKSVTHNPLKRYMVETHSEYLINRLRLMIVSETLTESDVKLYYIKNNGTSSEIFDIKLLKNGGIEGAPQDFFETYMMDVMEITLQS